MRYIYQHGKVSKTAASKKRRKSHKSAVCFPSFLKHIDPWKAAHWLIFIRQLSVKMKQTLFMFNLIIYTNIHSRHDHTLVVVSEVRFLQSKVSNYRKWPLKVAQSSYYISAENKEESKRMMIRVPENPAFRALCHAPCSCLCLFWENRNSNQVLCKVA